MKKPILVFTKVDTLFFQRNLPLSFQLKRIRFEFTSSYILLVHRNSVNRIPCRGAELSISLLSRLQTKKQVFAILINRMNGADKR